MLQGVEEEEHQYTVEPNQCIYKKSHQGNTGNPTGTTCLSEASGFCEQSQQMCVCGPWRWGKKREEKLGKAKGGEIKAQQDISYCPLEAGRFC